jgi:hypothetical protein
MGSCRTRKEYGQPTIGHVAMNMLPRARRVPSVRILPQEKQIEDIQFADCLQYA